MILHVNQGRFFIVLLYSNGKFSNQKRKLLFLLFRGKDQPMAAEGFRW